MLKKHQDPKSRPRTVMPLLDKPFKGMMISLAGRLTRTHVCAVVSSDPIFAASLNSHPRKEVNVLILQCFFLYPLQQYWKSKIEKCGGKVANSVMGTYINMSFLVLVLVRFNVAPSLGTKLGVCTSAGATCLVVSPAERERGGSSKLTEAM